MDELISVSVVLINIVCIHFKLVAFVIIFSLLFYRISAKFLWKRIPLTTKSAMPELESIWKVGKAMRRKDYPEIYTSLKISWSPDIMPLMQMVEGIDFYVISKSQL